MDFFAEVKKELDARKQLTENGAVGYETTGKALLDMNFKVASYRTAGEDEILSDFVKAYAEDPVLATKWVFYVGDIRQGLGERRLFRILSKYILSEKTDLIKFVGEYNRFDSLLELFGTPTEDAMVDFVKEQLDNDAKAVENGKPCSLLAKWMPSINTSSEKTKAYARRFISAFGMSEKEYRKTLSKIRSAIDVIEVKTCSNRWGEINYNTVPSKANLKYKKSFLKHDETRRREYLDKLEKGDKTVKINAAAVFPHDIVHQYGTKFLREKDVTLESMWKALPDVVPENKNLIVVRDGSYSMTTKVGGTDISALNVATALSVYMAERLPGALKDKFITFSGTPRMVDMSNCTNLLDKLRVCKAYDECSNTNIEATFDLLLNVVSKNQMKQEEIPDIMVISDMEFDECAYDNSSFKGDGFYSPSGISDTLFDNIAARWKSRGYDMPKLIFWNVNSRTNTIPVQQNKYGVALISGFSQNTVKMAMTNKLDPYEALKETLFVERYDVIK